MTKEQQIIANIEARLATVLMANGFKTSAGIRVYKNQEYTVQEQTRPLLTLFPGKNTITTDNTLIGQQGHIFEIGIEGVVDDNERGEETDNLRADLAKIIWQDYSFGGLIVGMPESVTIDSRVENAGEDGFIGFVQAGFSVLYRTAMGEL